MLAEGKTTSNDLKEININWKILPQKSEMFIVYKNTFIVF